MTSRGVPGGWMPFVLQESGMSNGFMQAPQSTSEGASMSKSRHSPVVKQKTCRLEVQALHLSQNSFVSPSHKESALAVRKLHVQSTAMSAREGSRGEVNAG
eukprot:CAMPEP_0117557530 /NCGR_PEP_ID=MMETSP0784-20121206/52374_1 /TAXON_ID=39447 /ORGANISM="" /LENGTH=100 /DNA_ID=CAMNT_0005354843 /DNA_START=192 /DNA_END=490 /DNA_ORIENTATION=-